MNFIHFSKAMQKHILIILLAFVSWYQVRAQMPSITRYLDAQNDTIYFSNMELMPDSGSVLIFQKQGNIVLDSSKLILCRVNDDGIPLQTISVKPFPQDQVFLNQTMINSNGELVILGRTFVSPARYFVLYIDPQTLSVQSLQHIRPDSSILSLGQMTETANGDLLVYGRWSDTTAASNLHHYPFILRMDRQGNVLWQKVFRTAPYNYGVFIGLKEYAPDRYLLLSFNQRVTNPYTSEFILWKMDVNGNVIDSRKIEWDGDLYEAQIDVLQSGNLLITGWLRQSVFQGNSVDDDNNTLFMEIDTALNPLSVLKFDDFTGIVQARENDSTLIISAWINSLPYIVRVDEQGNYLSSRKVALPSGTAIQGQTQILPHSNGTLHIAQALYNPSFTAAFNDYIVADGMGSASCRAIDTTFAAAVNLSYAVSPGTMPDTTYTVTTNSVLPTVSAYPNLIPVTLCSTPCVWPGDANSDGTSDLVDLLNVGVAFGSNGQARIVVSNDWLCQASEDWTSTFSGGLPYQHADCNGDGIVNAADTVAIQQNYGLSHNKANGALNILTTDPSLAIVIPQDSAFVGDTVHAEILLGEPALPVDSIYGIAFRILYDPTLVDSGTLVLNFDSSWIGTPSQALSLQQDNYGPGYIDGAIVRTDGNEVGGFGPIARLSFVLIDNIEGKRQASETLPLQIGSYTAIDFAQNLLTFSTAHDSIVVQDTTTSAGQQTLPDYQIQVFPNPFEDEIQVRTEDVLLRSIRICNSAGKVFLQTSQRADSFVLSLTELPSGVYFLSFETDRGTFHRKVVKR